MSQDHSKFDRLITSTVITRNHAVMVALELIDTEISANQGSSMIEVHLNKLGDYADKIEKALNKS